MMAELTRDECRALMILLKRYLRWICAEPIVLDLYKKLERGAAEVSDE